MRDVWFNFSQIIDCIYIYIMNDELKNDIV